VLQKNKTFDFFYRNSNKHRPSLKILSVLDSQRNSVHTCYKDFLPHLKCVILPSTHTVKFQKLWMLPKSVASLHIKLMISSCLIVSHIRAQIRILITAKSENNASAIRSGFMTSVYWSTDSITAWSAADCHSLC